MLEFIAKAIIIPIIVISIILKFLSKKNIKKPLTKNTSVIIVISVYIITILIFFNLSPYKFRNVKWYYTNDNQVLITGKLLSLISSSEISDCYLQVKVFKAGHSIASVDDLFPMTNKEGIFYTKFNSDKIQLWTSYIINIGYNYNTFLLKNQWYFKDFIVDKPEITLVRFRSKPMTLSEKDVIRMISKYSFFVYDHERNKIVYGFTNEFEAKTIKGDKVVIDYASGLMWQQGGSDASMTYKEAEKWIEKRNQRGYAGFHDWRLPTLEEAISLVESERNEYDLLIDPIFSKKQNTIFTCDFVNFFLMDGKPIKWVVSFFTGGFYTGYHHTSTDYQVRMVRSLQSWLI